MRFTFKKCVNVRVNRIVIRNFKNLRDVNLKPKKYNVIVGPNGSGKTNFLEFFKLLRRIYVERCPYPFLEWGGYDNVVWNRETRLPIGFEVETVEEATPGDLVKRYVLREVSNEREKERKEAPPLRVFHRISAELWAKNERLVMLRESAEVEVPELNYRFSMEKDGDTLKISLNGKTCEIDARRVGIRSLHLELSHVIREALVAKEGGDQILIHDYVDSLLFDRILEEMPKGFMTVKEGLALKLARWIPQEKAYPLIGYLPTLIYHPLLTLFKTIVLFPLNLAEVRRRKVLAADKPLEERGENALDSLYFKQLRDGRLPERVEYAIRTYFGGTVYFKEGNLYFYDQEGGVEFPKEHLPDGLLKTLVILTAVEQEPSMILIDEMENSLHAELLEFLVRVLREDYGGCVFLTTHSPLVVDLVEDLEELWVFKPTGKGVEVRNAASYRGEEELRKELEELGLSLGYKVLYGLT